MVFPFYIGDDVTDEDAFRIMGDLGGIGIIVIAIGILPMLSEERTLPCRPLVPRRRDQSRAVSVGDLLRGEMRAAKPRGMAAAEALAQGRLLSDEFTLELLSERLEGL